MREGEREICMSIRAFQGTCLHCGHDHDAANEAFRKSLESAPLPSGTSAPSSEGVQDKFTCPNCGSHSFGTSSATEHHDQWVRHCHGWIVQEDRSFTRCGFQWPYADDAKYGLGAPSEGGAPSRELLRQARVILLKAWERSGQGALGPIAMILADLEAECDGKRSPRSATAPIDAVPFEKIIGVTRAFDHIDGTEVNIPWVRVFFPDDDWESRDRFAKAIAAIADGRKA